MSGDSSKGQFDEDDIPLSTCLPERSRELKRTCPPPPTNGIDEDDDKPLSMLFKKKPKLQLQGSTSLVVGNQVDMDTIRNDLRVHGYAVVRNVLSPEKVEMCKQKFYECVDSHPHIRQHHRVNGVHGIFKYYEAGHWESAWNIRTDPAVISIFQDILCTKDLVVSFDGSCWMPKEAKYRSDGIWTHSDQAPNKVGFHCYQGFVSLTHNKERTLVVYDGSHMLHQVNFFCCALSLCIFLLLTRCIVVSCRTMHAR